MFWTASLALALALAFSSLGPTLGAGLESVPFYVYYDDSKSLPLSCHYHHGSDLLYCHYYDGSESLSVLSLLRWQ